MISGKTLRQIVSKFNGPMESLVGKFVLVVSNFKKSSSKSMSSNGMILTTSYFGKTNVLSPPNGVKIGEVVRFEGIDNDPDKVITFKVFTKVARHIFVVLIENKCVVTYKGIPFMTSAGVVTC